MKNIRERSIADIVLSDLRDPATRTIEEIVGRDFAADEGYVAQGVHFDGATWLSLADLACTDNGMFTFAFSIKRATQAAPWALWVSDSGGVYSPVAANYTGADFRLAVIVGNGSGGIFSDPIPDDNSAWHSVLASFDFTTYPWKSEVLFDGISVATGEFGGGAGISLACNGKDFWVGSDTYTETAVLDVAVLRVAPGISILDGSGHIPLLSQRAFFTAANKPENPSVATALLGTPGAVLLSASVDDAASFATNQGTGGAFATTGALTLSATSP